MEAQLENTDRKPTNIMGVSLLHKCNFNCDHCGYIYVGNAEDHIIKPGYKLTWDQVKTAIDDSCRIDGSYWNFNYTGGEPTLWEDEDKTLVDILIETALAGQSPSYNTNGSYFDDYAKCRELFFTYMDATDEPLGTFISMDNFHNNYDKEKGRAKSLDNLVRVMEEIPEEKRSQFRNHVVIIVTNDVNSSLPDEMKAHYGASGIIFSDFPLMPIGKAKELTDQIPEVDEYFPHMKNNDSRGPHVLVLVGDDYYVGNSRTGKLGRLADLYSSASK